MEIKTNVEVKINKDFDLKPSLYDFLMHHTKAKELCMIRINGYIQYIAYIDYEDLFIHSIPNDILHKYVVESENWYKISIVDENGIETSIPCHNINICEFLF